MKKVTILTWTILLMLIASIASSAAIINTNTNSTTLFVDPSSISEPVGATFTITIKLADVENLYGIDIQFTWDPTIIKHVSHQKKIPVETYPDGIMHSPTIPVKDQVDETASMPGSEPGTRYWLVEASMLPAASFDGSGTVFEMTFEVVDVGTSPLEVVSSTLADEGGTPIEHQVINGEFSNVEEEIHDIAITDVTCSPTTVTAGDSVSIDVTVENQGTFEETFDIAVYYDGNEISTLINVPLDSGESNVLPFTWDTTGVPVGTYVISAEASIVAGEEDVGDNSYTDGEVMVVSIPPPTQYELIISATAGGTTDPTPGTYLYDEGVWVSVTAYPFFGYEFDYWELNEEIHGENPIGVYMDDDYELLAVFVEAPTPPPVEDTVKITICPEFSSGEYPEWKEFTITNLGMAGIIKVVIVLPETDPMLDPETIKCDFEPGTCPDGGCGWIISHNEHDREITAESSNYDKYYVPRTHSIIIKIKFKNGPSNCLEPVEFHITISDKECGFEKRTVLEYIDMQPPQVDITFPGPESLTKDPENDYVFKKECDGTIWVQKPDGTKEKINWVLVEGTVRDPSTTGCPYASGIDRVEIWILFPVEAYDNPADATYYPNGVWVYMGDATIEPAYTYVPCTEDWTLEQSNERIRDILNDNQKPRTWWWRIDPSKEPHYKAHDTNVWVHWQDEAWYAVKAIAFDNAVNNIGYWEINQEYKNPYRAPTNRKVLITNHAETDPHWFFWMDCTFVNVPEWVPGNGVLYIHGETGFNPGSMVTISLWDKFYGYNFPSWTTIKADSNGRFYKEIRLPELPRHPHDGSNEKMFYYITATDEYGNKATDRFILVPWITYENTLPENDVSCWDTTEVGSVFDTVTVYGHGFFPSRKTGYDPYSTAWVHIVYTDVAPLETWKTRTVFNGSGSWLCGGMDELTWSPRLSEIILANVHTDNNGYWTATIQIPQSYGGLHAIYAIECNVVTDPYQPGPGVPQGDTAYDLLRSGWPKITGLNEEQAAIFDVWPTIHVSPSTAITKQYVTITGEGLPLPKYYSLWINEYPVYLDRDWCLVLDFGPYKQWVFENKRILNNELDLAWVMETWYPFSFYSPDPAMFLDSPVWKGKLTSVTIDFTTAEYQLHIGSKYLKVPVLPADTYEVMIYYFDKDTTSFKHDHHAATTVNVLKDPLHVNVEVGKLHFPSEIVNVYVQVDVDGVAADATSLSLALYKGGELIRPLTCEKVATGFYVATFECPSGEGNYFIKAEASKAFETFTLYGVASAGFTISPTLYGINAKLIALENSVATLTTEVGLVRMNISDINARVLSVEENTIMIQTDLGTLKATVDSISTKVVTIQAKVVTIQTDLGTLQTSIDDINGKVVAIEGKLATIETDIGSLKTNVDSINAVITGLEDDVVAVHTDVGDLKVKLSEINGIVTIEKDVATIKTDLGEIKGKVAKLEGDMATIETDIGTITAKADQIQGNVGLQPVTIGLSLVAALAAIAAAALILRRVYLK